MSTLLRNHLKTFKSSVPFDTERTLPGFYIRVHRGRGSYEMLSKTDTFSLTDSLMSHELPQNQQP